MNSAVGAIPGYYPEKLLTTSPFGNVKVIAANKNFWLGAMLIALIFISSLSVVYVQAQNRLLF
ncbi:unnamed protein product, partial [marine sediment metagenome]